MAGVVPDEGEHLMLAILFGQQPTERLELRLFTNDREPALSDTVADYVEMAGHGYAPLLLDPQAWRLRAAQPGAHTPAVAEQPEQTFLFERFGPGVAVYGYLLVGAATGRLWVAERTEDGPLRVDNPGDEILVRPRLRLRSEAPVPA